MVSRLLDRLSLKVFVWLSLATQIGIVVTGGLVRLTGSGLGCPTWPKCTDDSFVNVPEMGIHGVIEFGNRLLTFVLLIVSVLNLVVVIRKKRRELRALSILLLLGIPAQAVLGGITVLVQLNPWFVGGHFVLSGILISLASILVWRFYAPKVSASSRGLSFAILVAGWVTVLVGVVVTGAGPHSGDANTPRNGLDLEIWQHYHSYPAYLLITLTALQFFMLSKNDRKLQELSTRISFWLLVAEVMQAVLGLAQARLGVPPFLVAVHMLGASILISLITFNFLATRKK